MKILGITLARGGSKSVPLKNIRPILKKPLIYYTIKEAKKSKLLTDYIVSTDHKRIFEISKKYGASVPFIRPTNLSRDNTTSVASLQHAVNFMEKEKSIRYDFIVEIMCTNPLKKVVDIDNCIKKIIRTKADTVIAVHQLYDHHPLRIKKIVNDKLVNFCLKEKLEQDVKILSQMLIRSGSIYAISRDHLMKNNKRYGYEIADLIFSPPERY